MLSKGTGKKADIKVGNNINSMSQRRSRYDQLDDKMAVNIVSSEVVKGDLKLDEGNNDDISKKIVAPLSIDELYRKEREEMRIKHWKESPFAAGLVNVSWKDETSCAFGGIIEPQIDPESAGCLCCSAMICGRIGAGRVGNMAVLNQSLEWVEEIEEDAETGQQKTRRFTRPKLHFVMGPYWPMLVCVTYPLIFGISFWTLISVIPSKHVLVQVVWLILTVGLIYSLAMTAFRDPGILLKYHQPPTQEENGWRWNDSAQSYRPRGAFYDPDCAVIVEGFDHTCPWTGTAIGKKNMLAFQFFVGLIFVCLIFDLMLLTGALP